MEPISADTLTSLFPLTSSDWLIHARELVIHSAHLGLRYVRLNKSTLPLHRHKEAEKELQKMFPGTLVSSFVDGEVFITVSWM